MRCFERSLTCNLGIIFIVTVEYGRSIYDQTNKQDEIKRTIEYKMIVWDLHENIDY